MAKVLFTVSYIIPDAHRAEYLEIVAQMKGLIAETGVGYAVLEDEKQHNHFQEVYTYKSKEDFEASDDVDNPKVDTLVDRVYSLVQDRKVSYATFVEVA